MFEELRQRLRDAMSQVSSPSEGRAALALMREAIVSAKVAVTELREGREETHRRLVTERAALETVRRRGKLAADINDLETVRIAAEHERRHVDRLSVLQRKLDAQDEELALAEREVAEMTRQFKAAAAGVPDPGVTGPGAAPRTPVGDTGEDDLDAELQRSIDHSTREAQAERMLAELKRRMGR